MSFDPCACLSARRAIIPLLPAPWVCPCAQRNCFRLVPYIGGNKKDPPTTEQICSCVVSVPTTLANQLDCVVKGVTGTRP